MQPHVRETWEIHCCASRKSHNSHTRLNAASLASSWSYSLTVPQISFGGLNLGGSFIFFASTIRCWSRPGILANTPPLGVSLLCRGRVRTKVRRVRSGVGNGIRPVVEATMFGVRIKCTCQHTPDRKRWRTRHVRAMIHWSDFVWGINWSDSWGRYLLFLANLRGPRSLSTTRTNTVERTKSVLSLGLSTHNLAPGQSK